MLQMDKFSGTKNIARKIDWSDHWKINLPALLGEVWASSVNESGVVMKRQSERLLMLCSESNSNRDITCRADAKSARTRCRFTLVFAFLLGLLLPMFGPSRAMAQDSGTILGDVADSTGAVITQAKIQLVSTERSGWERDVTTNDHGEFVLPLIPAGDYALTVSKAGFEPDTELVTLEVNSKQALHFKLKPKAVGEKVEVIGASTGTVEGNSQDAALGAVLNTKMVEEIPLSDNSVVGVAQTLPGVNDVNAPTSFTTGSGGPTFSTSGSRIANNLFMFDGIMYNNLFRNTGLNFPSQEAIQEVSILINNLPAEYGRNSGAVFNVLTRSGGNKLHGALWDYIGNSDFNAMNWYNKWIAVQATGSADNAYKAKLVQNQFGATVGGPLLKDKLFFFSSYQGFRYRGALSDSTGNTPTAQELGLASATGSKNNFSDCATTTSVFGTFATGLSANQPCLDFSDLWGNITANAKSNPIDHYLDDPLQHSGASPMWNVLSPACITGIEAEESAESNIMSQETAINTARKAAGLAQLPTSASDGYLPGAKMPGSCMSPVILGLFTGQNPAGKAYLPVNGGQAGTGVVTAGNNDKTDDNGFIRFDYTLNSKNTMTARYNIVTANDFVPDTGQGAIASYGVMQNYSRSHFISIDDTTVLNANMVNVARAAYRRFNAWNFPTDSTTAADLGINFPVFETPTLPAISLGSYLNLSGGGNEFGWQTNKSYELDDALSIQHGQHSFQVGATFMHLYFMQTNDAGTQGTFHMSDGATGEDLGDFVLGDLNGNGAIVYYTARTHQGASQNNYFFYGKDDWRLSKRLTLNLGARWELSLPWQEPDNHWGTFIPGEQSVVIPSAPVGMVFPGDPGVSSGIIKMPKTQIMPRVGFSYDMFGDGKTALRGGFGIFYNAVNANVVQNNNQPWMNVQEWDSYANIQNPLAMSGLSTLVLNPNNPTFAPGTETMFYLSPDFKPAYAMAYNLGIQEQLPGHVNLEVNYVGKQGRHEYVVYQANPALLSSDASTKYYNNNREFYGYGNDLVVSSKGVSNYNGLQVTGSKRASKRLTFTTSYTWSRSIDLNSAESQGQLSESGNVPYVWDLASERAPSDFNTTHVANLGWVLDLPNLATSNKFLKGLTNNWGYGGVFTVRSGFPVDVTEGGDETGTGTNQQRPVLIGNWKLPGDRSEVDKVMEWFNVTSNLPTDANGNPAAAYAWAPGYGNQQCPQGTATGTIGVNAVNLPSTYLVSTTSSGVSVSTVAGQCPGGAFEKSALGTWGNLGRNSITGPGAIVNNMFLSKNFKLPWREGMLLEYKCQATGVFNHPIFGQPSGSMSSSGSWGRISSSKGERNLVMTLRLKF